MADTTKILKIDLKVDTGEAGKLITVNKEIVSGIDKTIAVTQHLHDVESKRKALIDEVTAAYKRTQDVVEKANTALAEGGRGWNLVEANAKRSLDATNRKLKEQLAAIKELNAEQLRLIQVQNSVTARPNLVGTATGLTPASTSPGNEVNQANQARLLSERLAREQAIIQNFNASTTRMEQEAASRRTFTTQSETNRRTLMYADMFNQLEARERQAIVNAQSFAQRINSVPRVASQGSQIDITGRMTQYLRQQQAATDTLTQAQRRNTQAVQESVVAHRSLFTRVFEIMGIYRILNTTLQLTKEALLSIPRAGLEQQTTQASLLGIFGTEKGFENIQFIKDVAQQAGQSLLTLEQAYRRYAPSAILAGAKQKEINQSFKDFAEVGTILHLPEEKINSLFLALDQMFAKGVVQSEEVKKQLGNVLPGVVEVFAIAMKKTPAAFMEAMRKNEIIAREAVPIFAKYYRQIFGGPDDSVFNLVRDRLQSNLFRLENSYTILNRAIFQDTQDTMNKIVKASIDMVNSFTRNLKGIEQAVILLSDLIIVRLVGSAITLAITNIGLLATKIQSLSLIVTGLNAPALASVAAFGALYLKVNKLSLGYNELYGFTVKYKEAQVSLTSYLESVTSKALENIISMYDRVTKAFSFLDGLNGVAIWNSLLPTETILNNFSLIINGLDKIQAYYQTLKQSGEAFKSSQPFDFSEAFNKNLASLKDNTTIFDKSLAKDIEKTLKELNGQQIEDVIQAIATGRLQNSADITYALAHTAPRIEPTVIGGNTLEDLNAQASDRLAGIYSNTKKILDEKVNQLKDTATIAIQKLEEQKNNFETLVRIAAAQKNPINEAEQNLRFQDFAIQKIKIQKQLAEDIAKINNQALQDTIKFSDKHINSLTKAKEIVRQLETGGEENPNRAVSRTGALGAYQLQPSTINQPGYGVQGIEVDQKILDLENKARVLKQKLSESEKAILADYAEAHVEEFTEFFHKYFEALNKHFNNDIIKTIAAYNAGPGAIDKGLLPKETAKYVAEFKTQYDPKAIAAEESYYSNIKQTQADIAKVQADANAANNEAKAKAAELLARQLEIVKQIDLEYIQAKGPEKEARELTLIEEKQKRIIELRKLGVNVSDTMLEKLYKQKAVQQEIKDLEQQATLARQDANQKYTNALDKINILVNIGAKTQLQAAIDATEQNRIYAEAEQTRIDSLQRAQALDNPFNESFKQRAIVIKNATKELELFNLKANEVANMINSKFAEAFDNNFAGFITGSQTATEAFRNFGISILDTLAKILAQEIRIQLVKGVLSLAGNLFGNNSGLAGDFQHTNAGNFFKIRPSANGNVFSGNSISAFSGTIVDKPTMFATGGNVMGEDGPEAVLPLKRNSQGKLGVILENSGQTGNNVYNLTIHVTSGKEDKPADVGDKVAQAFMRAIAKEEISKAARPGNQLNRTTAFG